MTLRNVCTIGMVGVKESFYAYMLMTFGSSLKVIEEVKEFLSNNFEMKDLEEADVMWQNRLI